VFGFLGVTDIRYVRAEGVAMGADAKAQALSAADVVIQALRREPSNQPQARLAA